MLFEGDDDKDQSAKFLASIGVSKADIAKLQKGEFKDDEINALVTSTTEASEAAAEKRIRAKVVKEETVQIAKGIYSRVEEQLIAIAKPLGFKEEVDLKDVDEKDRYKTIVKRTNALFTDKIKEVEKSSGNADAAVVTQLKEQLEAANALVETKDSEIANLTTQKEQEVQAVRDEIEINSSLAKKISSYEQGKLRQSASNINDLVFLEMNKRGLKPKVERNDQGKVTGVGIVDSNGAYVKINGTSKNYDLDSFFEEVGKEREFFAKSNGNPDKKEVQLDKETQDQLAKNLPPEALAALEKMETQA